MYVKISGWKLNGILRRTVYEDHESISGHFGNRLSWPERMKETQDVWEFFKKGRYDVYISDVAVYEINM